MTDVAKPARPFNQPVSRAGRAIFALIGAMERAVRRSSTVGLGPFFAEEKFPWAGAVKARWREVESEAKRLLAERERLPAFQEISSEVAYITQDRQWKTFMLVGYGLRSQRGLDYCPATAALLREIPGLRTAFFSILEPGKRLPLHRGPYNGVLRLHLGLVVPSDARKCWIRVGGEERFWQPGQVLIFDDALMHEVHNDTTEARVVLFVDFLRPCRWPVSWLNRLLVYLARFSPLVQGARRRTQAWEQSFFPRRDGSSPANLPPGPTGTLK